MRIACVHLPQFALQSLSRIDPALRSGAIAVVGAAAEPEPGMRRSPALHGPIVVACSRAAWAMGVRLGMTATAARFLSPELRIVTADAQRERETVRSVADALLGMSSVVDQGGRVTSAGTHFAMYCEVPSKMRGQTFGERLLALLEQLGLNGRVGIADDRFTAWVAAAHGGEAGGARQAAGRGRGAGAPRQAAERADARVASGNVAGAPQEGTVRVAVTAFRSSAAARAVAREDQGLAGMAARRELSQQLAALRDGNAATWQARNDERAPAQAGEELVPSAAKRDERLVISVPRGGSAAFLAPRPLSLLAITPEVQHMLESLGVRTLGEFAALPAPSVARPLESDYQALARGESGHALRPYAPDAPVCEELSVGGEDTLFGTAAVVTSISERLAARLRGRGRSASRLEITTTASDGERARVVGAGGASTRRELIEIIAAAIGEGPITKLRVVVAGEGIAGGASGSEDEVMEGLVDALSAALSSAGAAMPLLGADGVLSPLALPGVSQPWQVSATQSMRSERQDLMRRTRRARPRPRTGEAAEPTPLFGKLDS